MEAHEIIEKLKKNEGNYDEILQWCEENIDTIDLGNNEYKCIYDEVISHMIQFRIKDLTEVEAGLMVKYLASVYLREHKLASRVEIAILNREEFSKKYKELDGIDETNAICNTLKGLRFEIDYSTSVTDKLRDGSTAGLLNGLSAVFHEACHVVQECLIALHGINGKPMNINNNSYQIAIEAVAKKADPEFYDANYEALYTENQAEKVRIITSM